MATKLATVTLARKMEEILSHKEVCDLKKFMYREAKIMSALEHPWIKLECPNTLDLYPLIEERMKDTIAKQRWRCLGLAAGAVHLMSVQSPSMIVRRPSIMETPIMSG